MKSTWLGLALVAIAVTIGVACGEDGSGSPTNTTAIQLGATNYVTIPPTATTLVATDTSSGPQPEQEYVIQQGDYPATIAQRFNVPFAALMEINGWVLQGQIAVGFPGVGATIKIPSGGTVVTVPTTGAAPGATVAPGVTPTAAPAATVPSGSAPVFTAAPSTTVAAECAGQGQDYTITASDTSRLRVANKFGISVEQLDAANASTSGYSAFYPGLVIRIPAASGSC